MDKFELIKTLVILIVMIGDQQTLQEPFPWHEYPEVQGLDFCAGKKNSEGICCAGRNDSCTVPLLDATCYCDMFCDRTEPDCCPDFVGTCMDGGRTIEAHKAAQLKYAGTKTIDNNCFHEGTRYFPGEQIKFNCNNCTCVYAIVSEEYNWECTQKICLVRTSVLNRVNQGAFGWRAENYSFLWGSSLADGASYKLGTERPLISLTQVAELKVKDEDIIPVEFDARTKWPGLISHIQDQGMCAASWAFSATSVASDRLAIHSGGKQKVALAPQQLVSCNTQGQSGCQGGHVDRAWWYMRSYGLVSDDCYPYRSGKSGSRESCVIPKYRTRNNRVRCASKMQDWSRIYRVTPPYRIAPIEKEIMKEIMDNGPVQATIQVEEDFYLYTGGVYQDSMPAKMLPPNSRKSGYHSVKIIGWGVDTSSGKPLRYWLCANSWGTEWGEDGYFRIVRGANEAEIESFVLATWASVRNRRAATKDFVYTPTPDETRVKRSTNQYLTTNIMEYLTDLSNNKVYAANYQEGDTNEIFNKVQNNDETAASGDTKGESFSVSMKDFIKSNKSIISNSKLGEVNKGANNSSIASKLARTVPGYSQETVSTESNYVIKEYSKEQPAEESDINHSKESKLTTQKRHGDTADRNETMSNIRSKKPH